MHHIATDAPHVVRCIHCAYIITNNISDLTNSELSFPELKIVKPEHMLKGE